MRGAAHQRAQLQPTITMQNTINIFDIETAPNHEAVKKFTKPFDRSSVKVGNLKPENAQAKVDEAESSHWAKAHDKAALNPHTAEIVAIGIHLDGDSEVNIIVGEESFILAEFWSIFNDRTHEGWAYYTGSNDKTTFDPRHIIVRSWVNGVTVPLGLVSDRGYLSACFIDMAQVYLFGATYPTYCSADLCAEQLGIVGEDVEFSTILSKAEMEADYGVSGKNVHEFFRGDDDKQAIAYAYLENDLALERGIAKRIF